MRFRTTLPLIGLATLILAGCTHASFPLASSPSLAPVSAQSEPSREKLAISLIKKRLEVKNLTCPEEIELEETENPMAFRYTCRYRERQPEYGQVWSYRANGRVFLKSRRVMLDDLELTNSYQDPGGDFGCDDEF